ncbi:hypothetical protein CMI37_20330 [Candidatus Pacearchaeota archaeon]|nr:hypothetical protein [Candidatus Pacearchaeota archaeon]|tara:strand:+ start:6048 stop:6488 length:441 start_codon:yes stop_codon:yes gene_type:complete
MPICECGAELKRPDSQFHIKSKRHVEGVANGTSEAVAAAISEAVASPPTTNGAANLDPGLQGALDIGKRTDLDDKVRAQMIAKTVRLFFASKGWPNSEHSGTVADFLTENNVLILTPNRPPKGVTTTRATNDPAMGPRDPAFAAKE